MARLIDADELAISSIDITDLPTGHGLMVYLADDVNNAPTVDTIPREKIDEMIAEINRKACELGDYSERAGLYKAVDIIRKYTKEQTEC